MRIVQLSDTHFLEEHQGAEGGFAYDTGAAFDAVAESLDLVDVDHVVVTGDIADHGRPEQYEIAAGALGRLDAPVHVVPGNHDGPGALTAGLVGANLHQTRVLEGATWCHLFVDSNDPAVEAYDDRLHGNGVLTPREREWIVAAANETEAAHLFVWVHHPPDPPVGLSADAAYAQQWHDLLGALPRLRGIAGGHTHVPGTYRIGETPVAMAPALKNNFDLDARTMLPPGWRTWNFHDDGRFDTDCGFVDDPRWPRAPFGRATYSLLNGELSWDDFNAIVARKQAEG